VSEQAGRYQRSAAGMVGAMIVLVLVVAAFVLFRDLNRSEPASPVQPVDYQETLGFAQDAVGFALLAPPSLPDGWRATSATFVPEPPRWHLGVLTDENRYIGLEQSRSSVDRMVETYVDREAVKGRPVQVAGETWQTWTDDGGDTALTRVQDGVAVLVVGTPELAVLVDYAESLR
jgi:Protein of unknown function (DUF4245)